MAVGSHLRRNWKKYGLGIVTWFGSSWAAKKHREGLILERYCLEAKKYGQETISLGERPKKVYVFLNPLANNRDAKRLFLKYSAPLLHLWGADVIIIESDYEGQAQTLIKYIQPSTAALIVAGGGGTLIEVVNGLLKRSESEHFTVPVGVLPLGKENTFFKRYLKTFDESNLPARIIGEATMNIIRGNTRLVDVMKLQPSKGNSVYALSSIDFGALHDAETNKDSFWIFGRLRSFFSFLNVAIRRWPFDFMLDIKDHITNTTATVGDNFRRTIGFNITLDNKSSLACSILPTENITKFDFIKEGFMKTLNKGRTVQLPVETMDYKEMCLLPYSDLQQWFIVDGEPFEALLLNISVDQKRLQIFIPQSS